MLSCVVFWLAWRVREKGGGGWGHRGRVVSGLPWGLCCVLVGVYDTARRFSVGGLGIFLYTPLQGRCACTCFLYVLVATPPFSLLFSLCKAFLGRTHTHTQRSTHAVVNVRIVWHDIVVTMTGWTHRVLFGDLPPLQAAGAREGLRRLRRGGDLQGDGGLLPPVVHPRQSPYHGHWASVPGVPKHVAHAHGDPLRASFRQGRGRKDALRHLPGLRQTDPVCERGGGQRRGSEQRQRSGGTEASS